MDNPTVEGLEDLGLSLVGFVSEPNLRGTLSILFSCLLTLVLCVWSAIHLNLPKRDETEPQYIWRYLRWSVLGVFGPELVLWAAWRQFISARALTKMVKNVQGDHKSKSNSAANQWTMVHSFYAGAGGIVFDLESPEMTAQGPRFVPPNYRWLHLTPRGVQVLAQCGLLPDIPLTEIEDKSNSDATGKFICCLQGVWMLVESIARVAAGLPVTPLEINTIGHVLCALASFLLWWHKPRWIREPTVLRGGDWLRPMCAYMFMSSQVSEEDRKDRDLLRDFGVKAEISGVLYVDAPSSSSMPHHQDLSPSPIKDGLSLIVKPSEKSADSRDNGVMIPRTLLRRGTLSHTLLPVNDKQQTNSTSSGADNDMSSSEMRRVRWQLACECIRLHPELRHRLEPEQDDEEEIRYREAMRLYPEMPRKVREERFPNREGSDDEDNNGSNHLQPGGGGTWACLAEELVVDQPRNWPGDDLVREVQGHLMGTVLWCVSTVYGAVHVAGWSGHGFPTAAETWFWRASALYLVFSGLLWSSLNLLAHCSGRVWWYWYDILAGRARGTTGFVLIIIGCCIGGTLYVIARTYLVLEAFISLRALPASAYLSPSWLISVPHL